MDNNATHDIFISYSRKNKDIVLPIRDELERLGFTCWIDLSDIPCGTDNFKKKVIPGIKQTRLAFLFFLSAESQASEYAIKEINFAQKRANKRVVLIRFNDDDLTDEFYFDYQNTDIIDWRVLEQREKLLHDLSDWSGKGRHGTDSETGNHIFMAVPARNRCFVGREDELARLHDLCEAGRIPLITGPGGVGKTELSYEFAHRYCYEYPEGCCIVPMEKALSWNDAFRFMLALPPSHGRNVGEWLTEGTKWKNKKIFSSLVPELLAEKSRNGRLLLVLDNVERADLLNSVSLSKVFVYGLPRNIHIIATMRHVTRVWGEGESVITFPLENLSEEAALKLISAKCPPNGSDELDAAKELVSLLSSHAWSVELIASEMASTYKRGGSYRVKLLSLKKDAKLLGEGQVLRKTTETNALDLLRSTLDSIKNDTKYWESLIEMSQIASLFPAEGVNLSTLILLWKKLFPAQAGEMSFHTVLTILQDYAIFRAVKNSQRLTYDKSEIEFDNDNGNTVDELVRVSNLSIRRRVQSSNEYFSKLEHAINLVREGKIDKQCLMSNYLTERYDLVPDVVMSMHRFTRAGLLSSIGDKMESLVARVSDVLLAEPRMFPVSEWMKFTEDSPLIQQCPWGKFSPDDIEHFLVSHPNFSSKFNVDLLPNMNRARLFACRPELVGAHSFNGLGSGALWFIAANQPELIKKIDIRLLTPEDWSFLLCRQPQFAYMCNVFHLFTARDWCRLLVQRPEFAERCDFNCFNKVDWRNLINERHELATKMPLNLTIRFVVDKVFSCVYIPFAFLWFAFRCLILEVPLWVWHKMKRGKGYTAEQKAAWDFVYAKCEMITDLRALRGEYKVPPSAFVKVTIDAKDAATADLLRLEVETLKAALRAESVEIVSDGADRAMPGKLGALGTVYLSLEGLVDQAAEAKRIADEPMKD